MNNKLIPIVMTLVVGIILAGSVLMPVLKDATTVHETFDNAPYAYYQMKELEVDDTWTRTDSTWKFNDETLTTASDNKVSVLATDNTAFRQNAYVIGTTQYSTNFVIAEVTAEGIVMFNEDKPISYTSGYGATPNGDYILKTYTDKAYVHGDTNLWVTGITGLPGAANTRDMVIHIEGTINDGVTVTGSPIKNGTTDNFASSDVVINYTAVDGFEDLYLIESVTFNFTVDFLNGDDPSETKSGSATYSTFVLPKEITAERTVHLTNGQIALMGAIPVLVIVALLVVAVGVVARRND